MIYNTARSNAKNPEKIEFVSREKASLLAEVWAGAVPETTDDTGAGLTLVIGTKVSHGCLDGGGANGLILRGLQSASLFGMIVDVKSCWAG